MLRGIARTTMFLAVVLFATAGVRSGYAENPPMSKAIMQPLDGKTFSGEMGEKGKAKGDADTFEFKDGKFRSTACDKYGFKAEPYTATWDGKAVNFESTTHSDKEGAMMWKGKATGDSVEGTATWKKGDKVVEYWFKGSVKPKA